jgi:hypothetical protein
MPRHGEREFTSDPFRRPLLLTRKTGLNFFGIELIIG